ncbi:hypothetical protein KIKIMORA_04730 [Brevundimonas phage vB_BpoS-Kikimora]|uniref:Uncharacterized protein n=1 Tax=Brevundimonas phage vB_BpoS-Kikimora TaxID=2948601 RepID=A0A9E7MTX0_9CAUD|nr:hypothetical protein KIKIMORA_04730 [Brevundimonas phage vB_BpoS-Kikimora]
MYPTFELWLAAANAALLAGYGIDYRDAGADESELRGLYDDHLQRGETVQECARLYAEDRDLDTPDAWTAKDLAARYPIPAPPAA